MLDDEEADEDDVIEEEDVIEGEEYAEDFIEVEGEGEDEEVVKTKTRRITLKFRSEVLRELSQGSPPPETNGGKHIVEDDGLDAAADVEDLEAEVLDLKATVDLVEDDEDDEGGPRKLTRRVTRQSSFSKPEVEPARPVHGRKGVARQNRPEKEKSNGIRTSPSSSTRPTMKDRLRKELRRPSRDEKSKKKKRQSSESEFEDEGDEPEDDDVSIESVKVIESEEDYSSGRSRRHSRKPPPSRGPSKRSRNVSDEETLNDAIDDELEAELREIGAEIPERRRQLRPTERMNYFIPPPPGKDDIFLPPPSAGKKRSGTGKAYGGFGGFGGDFSNMGMGDRFRGIAGLGTAGGADDSSDSVIFLHWTRLIIG